MIRLKCIRNSREDEVHVHTPVKKKIVQPAVTRRATK
jgi:hypothetical protein